MYAEMKCPYANLKRPYAIKKRRVNFAQLHPTFLFNLAAQLSKAAFSLISDFK